MTLPPVDALSLRGWGVVALFALCKMQLAPLLHRRRTAATA